MGRMLLLAAVPITSLLCGNRTSSPHDAPRSAKPIGAATVEYAAPSCRSSEVFSFLAHAMFELNSVGSIRPKIKPPVSAPRNTLTEEEIPAPS